MVVYLTVSVLAQVQIGLNKPFLRAAARLVCVFNPPIPIPLLSATYHHTYHTPHVPPTPHNTACTKQHQWNSYKKHPRNPRSITSCTNIPWDGNVPTFPITRKGNLHFVTTRKSVTLAIHWTGLDGWDWLDQNQILLAAVGQKYLVKNILSKKVWLTSETIGC